MNFSIISLHLYEVAETAALVNGQHKRALPAIGKGGCLCSVGNQEGESNECFRSRIVWFFLYLSGLFYIAAGNLGTLWVSQQN